MAGATTRIARMLQALPDGGLLEVFLPVLPEPSPEQVRARRAAVAGTLVAGLEMARSGSVTLQQDASWQPIRVT